jgi:hypothetical protein
LKSRALERRQSAPNNQKTLRKTDGTRSAPALPRKTVQFDEDVKPPKLENQLLLNDENILIQEILGEKEVKSKPQHPVKRDKIPNSPFSKKRKISQERFFFNQML